MMDQDRSTLIDELESLKDIRLPAVFYDLPEPELEQVHAYINAVLTEERAGLDKLFESMSPTMKYIPNFLLQSLTKKYIEPPIAARITDKLEIKQSVGIAAGLPAEYVAEVARYLSPDKAAALLDKFNKKLARSVVELLAESHPVRLLDILARTKKTTRAYVPKQVLSDALEGEFLSDHRQQMLKILD